MLESILPAWAAPSCENRSALAVGYGALSRVTGLDGLLRGFGAPAGVHWALAGGAAVYIYASDTTRATHCAQHHTRQLLEQLACHQFD